jgi:SH3-like domain-containing protein
LKGTTGNARRGPSLSHRIDWVFRHAGMPLRVTAEYGHWRRIEDRDGAGGWVHYALLSGVRTAIIEDDNTALKARPDAASGTVALASMGAIVRLGACTIDWCDVAAGSEDGWVPKEAIWGVDANELRE